MSTEVYIAVLCVHQVWVSSGSGVLPSKNLQQAEAQGQELLSALGCDNVACLRRLDAEDVMDAVPDDWKARFSTDLPQGLPAADKHHWLVQDGELIQQDLNKTWQENGLHYKIVVGTYTPTRRVSSSSRDLSQVLRRTWRRVPSCSRARTGVSKPTS